MVDAEDLVEIYKFRDLAVESPRLDQIETLVFIIDELLKDKPVEYTWKQSQHEELKRTRESRNFQAKLAKERKDAWDALFKRYKNRCADIEDEKKKAQRARARTKAVNEELTALRQKYNRLKGSIGR